MLRILLKKQIKLLFASFFYNKKDGKSRSKIGVIFCIGGFALLMAVVLVLIFGYLARMICKPMCDAGFDWFYLIIMEMIAMALGLFGSVFNTYASLYQAKDNDLLFSLPIPVRYILASRLLGVYLMGVMYSAVVMVPAIVVYFMNVKLTISLVVCMLLVYLMITLVLLVLSCILGWIVAKVTVKLKNKSILTVILSLLFVAAYYFIYFKASEWIQDMLVNTVAYGTKLKGRAYLLYALGNAGTGNWLHTLLVCGCAVVLAILAYIILCRSFIQLATAKAGEKTTDYKKQKVKIRSPKRAVLFKERRRYLSSAAYMMNDSLSVALLPLLGIFLLIKGGEIRVTVEEALGVGTYSEAIVYMIIVIMCFLQGLNVVSAASISMEGKSSWILRSLPVSAMDVLKQKVKWHVLLGGGSGLLCSICTLIAFRPGIVMSLAVIFIPFLFGIVMAEAGLMLNLLMPKLDWTDETAAVKQSMSALVTMLIGMAIPGGMLFLFFKQLNHWPIKFMCMIYNGVFLVLSVSLYICLKIKGTKLWDEL